jgi:hypothetical protein
MLGPSANPGMIVLVILGFFLLTSGLAYSFGSADSRKRISGKGAGY